MVLVTVFAFLILVLSCNLLFYMLYYFTGIFGPVFCYSSNVWTADMLTKVMAYFHAQEVMFTLSSLQVCAI